MMRKLKTSRATFGYRYWSVTPAEELVAPIVGGTWKPGLNKSSCGGGHFTRHSCQCGLYSLPHLDDEQYCKEDYFSIRDREIYASRYPYDTSVFGTVIAWKTNGRNGYLRSQYAMIAALAIPANASHESKTLINRAVARLGVTVVDPHRLPAVTRSYLEQLPQWIDTHSKKPIMQLVDHTEPSSRQPVLAPT